MAREILIHLNVTLADDDQRSADDLGQIIGAALEVGLEGSPYPELAPGHGDNPVTIALVEEI